MIIHADVSTSINSKLFPAHYYPYLKIVSSTFNVLDLLVDGQLRLTHTYLQGESGGNTARGPPVEGPTLLLPVISICHLAADACFLLTTQT